MVEKLTLGNTHFGALEYCNKGEMIETNMATVDISEQAKQMHHVAASRPGLGDTCLHFSLSGTQMDNERLTTSDYQRLMREHLMHGQGIDLSKHQYVMFVHKEGTGRAHVHAVVNRIATDGSDHNLWQWKIKGKASCRVLEGKYGLEPVTNDREPGDVKLTSGERRQIERTGQPCAKQTIKSAIDARVPEAGDLESLKAALNKDDVTLEILTNAKGPYGVTFTARDPSTEQLVTFAGGQIADNCKCQALIKRMARAQEQTQGPSPWSKLQTSIKENIPGCRTLDEFRGKLQAGGIEMQLDENGEIAGYVIDGKPFTGKLPRNATFAAVQERLSSNDTWRTIWDAIKQSIRGCTTMDELTKKLKEAGIEIKANPTTGELSYTVNGRIVEGKQIPRNATLAALQERIDRDQLWRRVNETVSAGIREGLTLEGIIDKLQEAGITTHQRWDEDGKLEIAGYSAQKYKPENDDALENAGQPVPAGTITLEGKNMPKHCTTEAIQARVDNNILWTSINEAVSEAIHDGADLEAVILKIQENGIDVQRDETGEIVGYSMQLFLDKKDDALGIPETRTITLAGDRVPATFTLAGIQERINRNTLWKKLNEVTTEAIRDGKNIDGIRDALKLAGIQVTTDPATGEITGYSDAKTTLEGDRIPQGCTTHGLGERIQNQKAFRAKQVRRRLAGAAAAAFASSGREEDEENEYRHRPGM